MKNNFYLTGANMNMRSLFKLIIFGLFLLAGFQNEVTGQLLPAGKFPKVINFSAVISDADNSIITSGEYNILFSLYTSKEGGKAVWSELHEKVIVEDGEINVQLGGASVPNPLNLSFNRLYYLGIKLNGNDELTPRIELLPSPFSIRTLVANNVRDNSITANKIAPNSVTNSKIKSVSWSKIKDLVELNHTFSRINKTIDEPSVLTMFWRRYGNLLEGQDKFLGTINDRNLVIKTDSIQRMLFDPWGMVVMGTVTDSVFFEVIGKTTLGNVYVKAKMGVGADFNETEAKLHIKEDGLQIPFKVDTDSLEVFVIENTGRVEITSRQTGADDEEGNYSLFVNSVDHGIVIDVDSDNSNSSTNYMTFWDDDGIKGRIEGYDWADYFANPKNIAHDIWFVAQGVALAVAIAATAAGGLEVPDIINGTAEVAYWAFQKAWDLSHLGVTYESGSGDYAEWLEKFDRNEFFMPGDIVGVTRGKISKNTNNAEQFMSISHSPLVLGNMPPDERKMDFEKVAFKGQVPVKVKGYVNKGDYIIPSGLNDGVGIAVEPEMMTAEEFAKVVGKSWEENLNEEIKYVNVSVGLKMNDLFSVIRKKYNDNRKLKIALAEKNRELDGILLQLKEVEDDVKLVKELLEKKSCRQDKQAFTLNKK